MISDLAVIVPAADEEDHIANSLRAINAARLHLKGSVTGRRVHVEVIVVLDDCHDATADIVARYPGVLAIINTAGNVGAARRLGADHALAHTGNPPTMWLANTDADSSVPADWLTQMVAHADQGVDLVLGTVRPGHGLPLAVQQAWLNRHHLRDGHSHIHGANLGIRASAYVTIGGWQPLRTGEDLDLANRAVQCGARVKRTAAIPVVTSSRTDGRAPYGFSSYLRTLNRWTTTRAAHSPRPATPKESNSQKT
jgi:cellulose synthase/poly-beta-1,6-N-acetylglucosamine synthase-like glycosyltransferase